MKKILFIVACVAAGVSVSAQQSIVKDAEKAMKSGKSYKEVYEMILPAMTNAETQSEAITFYIPGKAGFNQFDNMIVPRQVGRLPEGGEYEMAKALIGGYENMMKALPLDTVVDPKGKVKTKYSKEIHNLISGHYNDFMQAGIDMYNAKDFPGALEAWSVFVDLSENPEKFKINNVQNDSVISQYAYYAGLAAYELDKKEEAADYFKKVTVLNPANKDAWKNGLITSLNLNNPDLLMYFAEGGDKLFGKEDPDFTGTMINYYINNKEYDNAISYLDKAIANDPQYAQYYVLKGIIKEEMKDMPGAMELYKQAIGVDPTNGLANFQYGRGLYIAAEDLDNNADQVNYAQFKETELIPRYKEAIKYLEEAYKYDENNKDKALTLLGQLYYQINDEQGIESVKQRRLED